MIQMRLASSSRISCSRSTSRTNSCGSMSRILAVVVAASAAAIVIVIVVVVFLCHHVS